MRGLSIIDSKPCNYPRVFPGLVYWLGTFYSGISGAWCECFLAASRRACREVIELEVGDGAICLRARADNDGRGQ